MNQYATRDVAKKLGLSLITLKRYIAARKIPVPPLQKLGNISARLWTDDDIERVREILPKIANGRRLLHQKQSKKQTTTRKTKR